MAGRVVVTEVPAAADLDGPLLVADGAELAAGRAGRGVPGCGTPAMSMLTHTRIWSGSTVACLSPNRTDVRRPETGRRSRIFIRH
jgi:hypothetical protein